LKGDEMKIMNLKNEVIFESGSKTIKDCVEKAVFDRVDLSEANLFKADLSEANLFRADLVGADLSDANISEVDFSGADLSSIKLSKKQIPEFLKALKISVE